MHHSFKDWLKEAASAAGLTEDQLLKAAGAILLMTIIPRTPASTVGAEEAAWRLLKARRVLSPAELQAELSLNREEVESVLTGLEDKACTVNTYAYGQLIAVANDGTFDISKLSEEERAAVVSAAYANRSLNLPYSKVFELCQKNMPRTRSETEKVLNMLSTGSKRYTDLVAAGVPKARIYPTLKKLISEGKVRKLKRGLYALA